MCLVYRHILLSQIQTDIDSLGVLPQWGHSRLLGKFRVNACDNISIDGIFQIKAWNISGNIFWCIHYDNHVKVLYGTGMPLFVDKCIKHT